MELVRRLFSAPLAGPRSRGVPGSRRQRLRPILLTTATTIGGMMLLRLSHDPMFGPMAVSIMSGLLFATLLTLLFVPVLYTVFYRVHLKG